MELLTINEVSNILRTNSSRIRYYEKHGLIQNVHRDSNNHRLYTQKDLEILKFILCLRTLNMPIKEIKNKISAFYQNDLSKKDILIEHKKYLELKRNEYMNYIYEIDEKIKDSNQNDF